MKEPRVLESFEMVTVLLPRNAVPKLDGERTPSPGQHPLTTDKEACAPKSAASLVFVFGDQPEQAVLFVRYPGGEEDTVTILRREEIP